MPSDHYPEKHDVGCNCNLVLWMAEYGDEFETLAPWSVQTIYTSPFYMQDHSKTSLLYHLFYLRVDAACENTYISASRAALFKDKLLHYFADTDLTKTHSMAEVMAGHHHVPASTTFFRDVKGLGIYLPHNHVDSSHAAAVDAVLFNPPAGQKVLWDYDFPLDGRVVRFGDLTFSQVHATPLKLVYESYRDTFNALRRAIEAHIFRPAPGIPHGPCPNTPRSWDHKGIMRPKGRVNNKCCDAGVCATTPLGLYCGTTDGTPTGPCNAMSDPCP